jgi:hypothetical protein
MCVWQRRWIERKNETEILCVCEQVERGERGLRETKERERERERESRERED